MKNTNKIRFAAAFALLAAALITTCGRKGPDAPLTIVSTHPGLTDNNSVARNTVIRVTFSEPVDPATIRFSLTEGADSITCSMSYSGTVAVFQPATLLAANMLYTAIVESGVRDVSGNVLIEDYLWYFKTGTGTVSDHTVTASAGSGGTISPSSRTVPDGGVGSFTITAYDGFQIETPVAGTCGGSLSGTTYTTAPVTADCTVRATFVPGGGGGDTYTIKASAGPNGSISPSGTLALKEGASQEFTITADPGYSVADVTVDGTSVGKVTTYTFSNVTKNHTISATFSSTVVTYVIKATAGDHGTIIPSGDVEVPAGSSRTFMITPAPEYAINEVKVDGEDVGRVSSYRFENIRDNHSISASFTRIKYRIDSSAGPNGQIQPSGTVYVDEGASLTFNMYPDPGALVSDVLVDNVSAGPVPAYLFSNVTANHTISVSFSKLLYTITARAGPDGSIDPVGVVEVPHGSTQNFTMIPDTGASITDVVVDGASAGPVSSYVFNNVTADHVIEASFSQIVHTISATAGPNGSISPSGTVQVPDNGSQSFVMLPGDGYAVAEVIVDGASVGPVLSYLFQAVRADHTISASFSAASHVITTSAGPNGSIDPSGAVPVAHNGSLMVTIIPDPGYVPGDVLVDGSSVGAVASWEFTNVTGDHAINASFVPAVSVSTTTASGSAVHNQSGVENKAGSHASGMDSGFRSAPLPREQESALHV